MHEALEAVLVVMAVLMVMVMVMVVLMVMSMVMLVVVVVTVAVADVRGVEGPMRPRVRASRLGGPAHDGLRPARSSTTSRIFRWTPRGSVTQ